VPAWTFPTVATRGFAHNDREFWYEAPSSDRYRRWDGLPGDLRVMAKSTGSFWKLSQSFIRNVCRRLQAPGAIAVTMRGRERSGCERAGAGNTEFFARERSRGGGGGCFRIVPWRGLVSRLACRGPNGRPLRIRLFVATERAEAVVPLLQEFAPMQACRRDTGHCRITSSNVRGSAAGGLPGQLCNSSFPQWPPSSHVDTKGCSIPSFSTPDSLERYEP